MSALIKRQQPNVSGNTSQAVERLKHQFGLSNIDSKRQLILGLLLPNITNPFRRPAPCLIRIILDDTTKKIWYPGEEISGAIRLIVNEPIAVQHITLTLSGIAKAKTSYNSLEGKTACGSEVTLFSQSIEIIPHAANSSSSILAPKRYEHPFRFGLPQSCQDATGPDFKEATRLFDNSHSQLLPPSFSDAKSSERCKIAYSIVATLSEKTSPQSSANLSNLFGTKPVTHIVPLTVCQLPEPIPSTPIPPLIKRSTLSVRSSTLGPTSPHTSESSLRRLKSTLLPFASPDMSFHLFAHLPRYGIAAHYLPITLSLSHVQSPKKHDTPKILLTGLNVTLIPKTTTRTVPLEPSFEIKGSLLSSWQTKLSIASLNNPIEMPLEPERLEVGKVLDRYGCGPCLLPKATVGNFRTFNIVRSYSLRVEAEVECNSKKARAGFTVPGFVVFEEAKIEMDDLPMEETNSNGSLLNVIRPCPSNIDSEVTTIENSEDIKDGELPNDGKEEAKQATLRIADDMDPNQLLVKESLIKVPGEDALMLKIEQSDARDEADNGEGIERTEAEDITDADDGPSSSLLNRKD